MTTPLTHGSRRLARLAALVALASACSTPSDESADAGLPVWSAALDLRIGSVDDPASTLTFFREITVGPDGTMYVVQPQEQLIRVFEADGTPRGTIGGEGDGPGEFRNLASVGWVADTLWALDFRGYAFSHFDADGTYLGGFRVPFESTSDGQGVQPARAGGLLFDGTLHGSPPAFSHQIAAGTLTHDVPVLMGRDGSVTDTLPATPFGRNLWAISHPDGPERGGLYRPQPFGDGPLWAYANRSRALYVLDRDASASDASTGATLTKLSFDGDTIFSADYSFAAVPVTAAEADSVAAEVGDLLGERGIFGATAATGRAWAEETLYRPANKPAVRSMVVARDDMVWLELSAPRGASESEWLVVGDDGARVASVRLPRGVTVLRVDLPYVWASEQDELDVPYLVRFRVSPE